MSNKATGALAQLVEQRTENPCVPGSIPGGTTQETRNDVAGFFVYILHIPLYYSSPCFHHPKIRPIVNGVAVKSV